MQAMRTRVDRSGNEDWWHNNRIEMAKGYTTELLTRYRRRLSAAWGVWEADVNSSSESYEQ